MVKKNKSIVVLVGMIAFLCSGLMPLQATAQENSEAQAPVIVIDSDKETIEIKSEDFEIFLTAIVDAATESNNRALLSEALLNCYRQLKSADKKIYLKDMQAAMPELMEIVASYCQENNVKAPRPGFLTQYNGIVGPGGCDLSVVVNLLHQLFAALNNCCNEITIEFQQTWTILTEILNTVSACCASSTLTGIIIDISSTFSVLAEILIDIQGTFSALNSLGGCVTTVITQSDVNAAGGTYVITAPGNYLLAEDITSAGPTVIDIDSSDVTLDLCNRLISGNGSATLIGILVESGATNINIVNGEISDMLTDGIQINDDVSELLLSNIRVRNCGVSGIFFSGATSGIRNSVVENCEVTLSGTVVTGLGGLTLANCDNIVVRNGLYNNNGSLATTTGAGVILTGCANCLVTGALMNQTLGIEAVGLFILNSDDNLVDSCMANDSIATQSAHGFYAEGGLRNAFVNCVASNNTGPSAYGIRLGGGVVAESLSSVVGCRVESNVATTTFSAPNLIFGVGIFINGANGSSFNEILNNEVVSNNQSGIFDNNITFAVTGTASVTAGSSNTLVSGNSAVENGAGGPPFLTTDPYRNYTVAYTGPTPVEFVSSRYSTGTVTVSPAGATMIANTDARNAA